MNTILGTPPPPFGVPGTHGTADRSGRPGESGRSGGTGSTGSTGGSGGSGTSGASAAPAGSATPAGTRGGSAAPRDEVAAVRAWRALRDLRSGGGIAANWPSVPALLAAMDADHLRRAGTLLARLDPADVLAHHPGATTVAVTVTGSSTLDGLAALLAAETARHGIAARTTVSGFGTWFADLGEPEARGWVTPADLRLCVLDAHAVFGEVATPWGVADVERTLDAVLARLTAVADAAERAGAGTCVLNTLPLTTLHAHQLLDHRSRMRLGAAWREFNAALLRLGAERRSVVVVDLDVLATGVGPLTDPRLQAHARVPFTDDVLAAYAREVAHLARALTGRTRKCLVADLDGTLWGGILGDDGPEGVVVGQAGGSVGEAFAGFGHVLKQLSSQGVLLAVCSKNDAGQVAVALRDHPGLPLAESDFVAVVAGWEPKDAGLRAIARRLGLGTDSLVFVDDSSFEQGLVRAALPEVAVVGVGGDPALHTEALLADGWFTTIELTAADAGRGADYRAQAARGELRERCTSLSGYLAALAVEVDVRVAADADVGRLAQLTQRTNQFNLTTRRMSPAEVAQLVAATATAGPSADLVAPPTSLDLDHGSDRARGSYSDHFHGHFFDQHDTPARPPQDLRQNPTTTTTGTGTAAGTTTDRSAITASSSATTTTAVTTSAALTTSAAPDTTALRRRSTDNPMTGRPVDRQSSIEAAVPLVIRYRDRFGDFGIVGGAFLRAESDGDGNGVGDGGDGDGHGGTGSGARPGRQVWHIDNLLLSCRVFGRGVESACITALAGVARDAGAHVLRGHYAPTAKNARFADFYPLHGFTPVPGVTGAFDLDLSRPSPSMPDAHHIATTVDTTTAADTTTTVDTTENAGIGENGAAPAPPHARPPAHAPGSDRGNWASKTRKPDPKGGLSPC